MTLVENKKKKLKIKYPTNIIIYIHYLFLPITSTFLKSDSSGFCTSDSITSGNKLEISCNFSSSKPPLKIKILLPV